MSTKNENEKVKENQVKRPIGVALCAICTAMYCCTAVFFVVATIHDSARGLRPLSPMDQYFILASLIVALSASIIVAGLFRLEYERGWIGAVVLYAALSIFAGILFLFIFPQVMSLLFFLVILLNMLAIRYLFKVKDAFIR